MNIELCYKMAQLQYLTSLSISDATSFTSLLLAGIQSANFPSKLTHFRTTTICDDTLLKSLLNIPSLQHVELESVRLDHSYADTPCRWATLTVGSDLRLESSRFKVLCQLPCHSLTSPLIVKGDFAHVMWPQTELQKHTAMRNIKAVLQNVSRCAGIVLKDQVVHHLKFSMHASGRSSWDHTAEDDQLFELLSRLYHRTFWDTIQYEGVQLSVPAWAHIKQHFMPPSVTSVVWSCLFWRLSHLATLLPALPGHVHSVTIMPPESRQFGDGQPDPGYVKLQASHSGQPQDLIRLIGLWSSLRP